MCRERFCFFVGWFLGLFGIFHCWFEYYNIYYKHHGLYKLIYSIVYHLPLEIYTQIKSPHNTPQKIPSTLKKTINQPIPNNSNIIITIIYFQKPLNQTHKPMENNNKQPKTTTFLNNIYIKVREYQYNTNAELVLTISTFNKDSDELVQRVHRTLVEL